MNLVYFSKRLLSVRRTSCIDFSIEIRDHFEVNAMMYSLVHYQIIMKFHLICMILISKHKLNLFSLKKTK